MLLSWFGGQIRRLRPQTGTISSIDECCFCILISLPSYFSYQGYVVLLRTKLCQNLVSCNDDGHFSNNSTGIFFLNCYILTEPAFFSIILLLPQCSLEYNYFCRYRKKFDKKVIQTPWIPWLTLAYWLEVLILCFTVHVATHVKYFNVKTVKLVKI